MTMTHWLIVIFALAALAYRKRLLAMLRWHPAVWLANILFIALVIGWIALAWWLAATWGGWGIVIFFGLLASAVVALRLCTGRWYWQDDDVINLD